MTSKRKTLSYEVFHKIREDCSSGMSVKVLARKFELPDDCITQILTASSFEQASTRYSTVMTRQPKKVPRKVISARDLQILDMRSKGSTLDEIGGQFEITRERVRQIILKHARNEKFITPAEVKISEKLNALKAIRIEISANWNIYRRYSVTSLAKEYKLNESDLLKCVNKVQYAYLKANDESHIEKIWTKESCIRVLKDAATYAFPLTLLEYRKLVNSKTIEGPTLPIFVSRFGSWMEACRAAGVETGTPVREYDTNWSDTDLLLVVRRFMWETRDTAWSIDNYKKWRNKQDPKVASISILRLRLGPWSEIRVLALDLNAPDYDMAIFEELETHEE